MTFSITRQKWRRCLATHPLSKSYAHGCLRTGIFFLKPLLNLSAHTPQWTPTNDLRRPARIHPGVWALRAGRVSEGGEPTPARRRSPSAKSWSQSPEMATAVPGPPLPLPGARFLSRTQGVIGRGGRAPPPHSGTLGGEMTGRKGTTHVQVQARVKRNQSQKRVVFQRISGIRMVCAIFRGRACCPVCPVWVLDCSKSSLAVLRRHLRRRRHRHPPPPRPPLLRLKTLVLLLIRSWPPREGARGEGGGRMFGFGALRWGGCNNRS